MNLDIKYLHFKFFCLDMLICMIINVNACVVFAGFVNEISNNMLITSPKLKMAKKFVKINK